MFFERILDILISIAVLFQSKHNWNSDFSTYDNNNVIYILEQASLLLLVYRPCDRMIQVYIFNII